MRTYIESYRLIPTETHKLCFLVFIAASVCYMLLSYFVNKTSRSQAMDSQMGQSAVRLKRNLMFLNILSFTLAGYFFLRHNDRCEPYSKLGNIIVRTRD